ncbi:E3 UFM1-protein ligase 1 homolog [Agrilus planipennis]|uniref:E3 UFM1-protein ligase 1 homolog n=1 Tax=Agrilus planipennis TaxID=224129 RepID=A0A1W4WYX7_AGRPL|nr:E3 UFM1-protein ligase 1 homolog [Agrilus planipennis]
MADWEEIKRLAADFQKVQLSTSSQRLSERNCIEIVSWLIRSKKIDLIFTTDGKEYLTSSQLIQDIKSELYVNGGRVNLVELAKSIGVDLSHITAYVPDVIKSQRNVHSVLGQLIDGSYILKIAGEINEKLQQLGQINVSDLTIQYDLPSDFLQSQVLGKHLGKIIHGKQDKNDPKVYFTESFIARSVAKIRGALNGLTQPTSVSAILNQIDIHEKLFFTLFEQSCPMGFLTNKLPGAQYIPNIYSKSQNEWVSNFYKQNGYLEYDALTRLGISDYKTYLKNKISHEEVIYLKTCVVSKNILERIEADIDECISSKSYLDIQNNLPSVFSEKDIEMILDSVLTSHKQKQVLVMDEFIVSKAFVDSLIELCQKLLKEKAKHFVDSEKYIAYKTDILLSASKQQKAKFEVEDIKADSKREERRKKASGGKSGGGTQGRETKTKSTKKFSRSSKLSYDSDEPEDKKKPEIVNYNEIQKIVQRRLEEEGLENLIDPLVSYMLPIVNEKAYEIAENIYTALVADRNVHKRKSHNEVQEKINVLVNDIRLFEKGLKLFPTDAQNNLTKYLLKSHCTEVINEVLAYVAAEHNLNMLNVSTHEQRVKFVSELPSDYKSSLTNLLKTVTGQSVEDFLNNLDEVLGSCSMILKKVDKKKDRILVLNHKHALEEALETCEDPAEVLLLAVQLIFVGASQNMLHASGRHVSAVLQFLKQHLTPEQSKELSAYCDLVTLVLNKSSETETVLEQLRNKMTTIKAIALGYKKTSEK